MSLAKKVFITSSVLLAVALLLWGVYALSFRKPAPAAKKEATKEAPVVSIPAKKTPLKITAVSDEAVVAPTLTADEENLKYYSRATGQVFQTDLEGQVKKTISSREISDLAETFWSPDKTKAISHFKENSRDRFSYFNYAENKGVLLKENLDTVVWQGNNKIFYKYYNPADGKRTLSIADPDGSNWKELAGIEHRNVSIAPVPRTGLVSFWNSPDAFLETKLESLPIIGGEKKIIFQGKFGADFLWSPDGSRLLLSHTSEKGGSKLQLALTNDRGGEYRNLEFPTLLSKCAWSKNSQTIFCALPGSLPETAVLPNDYASGKINSIDTFWKINATNGEKERAVALEDLNKINAGFDATNLFLNSDESLLFFQNRTDGKLYRINL
jgi:hypothetical protein